MSENNQGRVGFCCKWIDTEAQINGFKPADDAKQYSAGCTTVRWLNEHKANQEAEQRLEHLMQRNIESIRLLIQRVGSLETQRRMVRLGSEILPVYTQPDWAWFWKQPHIIKYCEEKFAEVGALARQLDVRLSFHPGQFVVLASDNANIVDRSIEEFEYHCDMIRWMGYGQRFQDFKCNVHIAGKQGAEGILRALPRLSPEARNCITIENDEVRWGIEESLKLANHVALVLDIHHHWVREGEYIAAHDDRVKRIKDSWRGVRPALHYSVSREDVLVEHDIYTMPDRNLLMESGHKKNALRAHSDFYWNHAVNEWAASFMPDFDIQCESKGKNLARDGFLKSIGK